MFLHYICIAFHLANGECTTLVYKCMHCRALWHPILFKVTLTEIYKAFYVIAISGLVGASQPSHRQSLVS